MKEQKKKPSRSAKASPAPSASRRLSGRPTIVQVAQHSGVAPSTASHILNRRPNCYASAATRKRVEDAARELGYRPNLAARVLRGGRTATLGLITPLLEYEVTSEKCVAFEQLARKSDYVTMISFNPDDPELEDRTLEFLHDRCVDGVAMYPAPTGKHVRFRELLASGFPIVTIAGWGMNLGADDVSVDYAAGGALQALHLLELGRRKVWFIGMDDSGQRARSVQARVDGLTKALAAAGVTLQEQDWDADPSDHARVGPAYVQALEAFFAAHRDKVDAVVTANDEIGMAAIHAARQAGLEVPHDVAIMGYDNASISRVARPALTSIGHDSKALAAAAFEYLEQRINGYQGPARSTRIPPSLVVRASTVG